MLKNRGGARATPVQQPGAAGRELNITAHDVPYAKTQHAPRLRRPRRGEQLLANGGGRLATAARLAGAPHRVRHRPYPRLGQPPRAFSGRRSPSACSVLF